MRIEKLSIRNFDSSVVEGIARRSFMPPSLVPEMPDEPPPPPPPSFGEDDMKRAEQEGYRRGFLEGEREGKNTAESEQAAVQQQLGQAVKDVTEQLQGMLDRFNALAAEIRAEVPGLALAIARKVAGKALESDALPVIEEMALATLKRLIGEPEIVVTVNEKLAPALEEKLSARFAGNTDPGEITIHGDHALPIADCRIEWSSGAAQRDTAALWREIERVIGGWGYQGIREEVPVEPVLSSPDSPIPPSPDNPPLEGENHG